MKTSNRIKLAAVSSTMAVIAAVGIPATASAWMVNYSAKAECANNKAQVSWIFKNTEPNEAQWSMDIEVSDAQTGGKTTKTVKPGETVSGTFSSDKTKLTNGNVVIKMLWTDGRSGVDTRSTAYEATAECYVKPYVEPTFEAKVVCTVVDKKAVYTVNVKQTAGDDTLTFTPANNSVVTNGETVTVTGAYSQNGTSKTVTAKTAKVADCTPATETPKKEEPKQQAAVTTTSTNLPNTGAGSMISVLVAGTFIAATTLSQVVLRRKNQ